MFVNLVLLGFISDDGNSDVDDMWIIEVFSYGNFNIV